MWNIKILLVVAFSLFLTRTTANIFEAETYDCTIRGLASKSPDKVHSFDTICSKIGSMGQKIHLSGDVKSFVANSGNTFALGRTQLSIPLDLLDGSMTLDLDVDYGKRIKVTESKSASDIDERKGTYKIIVLRISDTTGSSPTASTYKMGQDIFSDTYNLVRTHASCTIQNTHHRLTHSTTSFI